jgi:hypothetical protein
MAVWVAMAAVGCNDCSGLQWLQWVCGLHDGCDDCF